jgi:hypothetical protein
MKKEESNGLDRHLNLLTLTATGICSMVGASIYVVPIMIQKNVPGIGPYVLVAFLIAAGTSAELPSPTPTLPFLLPITTSEENVTLFPPVVFLTTRRIRCTLYSYSLSLGSSYLLL